MKKIIPLFCLLILFANCHKKKVIAKHVTEDNANYTKARTFRDSGNKDSAFVYYNLAKISYKKELDSLGVSNSLINMAHIQSSDGDYYGAIESSLEANQYLSKSKSKPEIREKTASNFNSIGIASSRLGNYDHALKYYQKALQLMPKKHLPLVYNNIGDTYIQLGEYKKAIDILKNALDPSDKVIYAMALNNLATAKLGHDKKYNPLPEYIKTLKIREKFEDQSPLNSSYATLSDYYLDKNQDSAIFYAEKMLQTADKINNPDDQLQALRKLIHLDKNQSHNNLTKYIKINDSLNSNRFAAQNRFALIKSEITEAEARNAELALENIENKNQKIYAVATIGILLIILVFIILHFNKKRKIQQQEKQLEIRKTELKYSKKVHDVVANGIYQVMTKLENHQEISRNETLDDLEDIYNKSRNISYDASLENNQEDFSDKIRKLVSYFKNEKLDTYLAGNEGEIWNGTSSLEKSEIYQILRELLINMKKHSHADRVIIVFKRNQNKIEIAYSDNGIGIKEKSFFKNGLQNAVSRIENLNGDIIFDTETETGLKINFSVPVSQD
ncbi:tetratricopeptide repeat protein [Chryseobacterium sp.]|uniref:tetratricopeptide repeat-containing sensor histidine kinase n=1 Tax=Chryseobacterium sp. TaxID=1871047 RepID=UPI00289CBA1D|nr:tetratricopeptide repeat protein [Chryseobacterium sp.]